MRPHFTEAPVCTINLGVNRSRFRIFEAGVPTTFHEPDRLLPLHRSATGELLGLEAIMAV